MLLSLLLKDIIQIPEQMDQTVSRLVLDSRKIQKGDTFIAYKGLEFDGRKYIQQAIDKGATAVLVEADENHSFISHQQTVPIIPIIPINQLPQKLSHLAQKYYSYPAKKLRMIGVTGTNGKTSCTHFIAQSLQHLNIPCGIIGTLGSGFWRDLTFTGLTTPDALTLQATLSDLSNRGAKALAMEVSSHSIAQGRISDIEFELGIFTNLTQDHLDYHGDMETYASVKYAYLASLQLKTVIINDDDPYGKNWIKQLVKQKKVYAYCTQKPTMTSSVPTVFTDEVRFDLAGISAALYSPWGEGHLVVPLIGQFNLSNVLAVYTALCVAGVPHSEALNCLAHLQPVAGRMQTLGGKDKPLVVVDYAHSPDALEKVLQSLRSHTQGKLICVFGCGGERDHSKRKIMAAIAEKWADRVIVTNDNPRREAPEQIAADIMQGFKRPDLVKVLLDRSHAIKDSIQWASANDCVLIAGKGAEQYQQVGDTTLPFDDVEKAATYLTNYHLPA